MGRGPHCTTEERTLIIKLRKSGKTYKEISKLLQCSENKIINVLKPQKTTETRGRKRKTTAYDDRRMVRIVKKYPFITSTDIKKKLELTVTTRTIRNRLIENKLPARAARKVPFINKNNLTRRIEFAKDWEERGGDEKWRNVLWTDESKINLFGSDSKHYVRRPANAELLPKFTKKTVKHGGGSIMVWACFSWYGVGPIYWIKEIMDQHVYVNILESVMLPHADENMPLKWWFQQDNDPKHTSRKAKQWLQDNNIRVMNWPPQSPDLNPIENLWHDVKIKIADMEFRNKQELWESVKAAWESIPLKTCQRLVESMSRRCDAVLKNDGNVTKY